ncbi:AEC family transporter, partial [Arthrobacter deserti]|nr:AEC family transporter [Arthrobacter deserti]
MLGVLAGFSVVWVVILVGYFAGRPGVLGPDGSRAHSRLAFFVASPCLLLETLSRSSLAVIFSDTLVVAGASAAATAAAYFVLAKVWFRR